MYFRGKEYTSVFLSLFHGICNHFQARVFMVSTGLIYTTEQAGNIMSGNDDLLTYRKAVESNGGVILELFQNDDNDTLESKFSAIRGLIIPGGGNSDPAFYNETPLDGVKIQDPEFDRFCFRVLRYAVKKRVPVLGICRGHQFLNIYFGGTLYQDIPRQYKSNTEVKHRDFEQKDGKVKAVSADHLINIREDSQLFDMFESRKQVMVNSTHQQAVKDLASGFEAAAWAEDMIIEAIISTGETFMMGVQFHPEKLLECDSRFNVLFRKLTEEAKSR
jgi:putative glutamine amidotransferase